MAQVSSQPTGPSTYRDIAVIVTGPSDPSYASLETLLAVARPEIKISVDVGQRASILPWEIGLLLRLHRQATARDIPFRLLVADEGLRRRLRQLGRDVDLVVDSGRAQSPRPD